MPRALLLGFTVPDAIARELFRIDPAPAVQTHKFAWSLARALRHGGFEVDLLSSCPVQGYPQVRKLSFADDSFVEDGFPGRLIGFINITGAKHLGRLAGCLASLPRLLRRERPDVVLLHGVHSPYLIFSLILRLFGIPIVAVLTDPPGVILPTDGILSRRLKHLDRRLIRWILSKMSGVAALSGELVKSQGIERPSTVFPGIVNRDWLAAMHAVPIPSGDNPARPVALYAGGLSRNFGIPRLLATARQMPDMDFRFFGKGECVDDIMATDLPNVHYGGYLNQEELARQVAVADVLVNCRPTRTAQARETFPSKLIEYLATGKPVITSRLTAIPQELSSAFIYIEGEEETDAIEALQRFRDMTVQQRTDMGMQGREAVLRHFSEAATGERLAKLFAAINARE